MIRFVMRSHRFLGIPYRIGQQWNAQIAHISNGAVINWYGFVAAIASGNKRKTETQQKCNTSSIYRRIAQLQLQVNHVPYQRWPKVNEIIKTKNTFVSSMMQNKRRDVSPTPTHRSMVHSHRNEWLPTSAAIPDFNWLRRIVCINYHSIATSERIDWISFSCVEIQMETKNKIWTHRPHPTDSTAAECFIIVRRVPRMSRYENDDSFGNWLLLTLSHTGNTKEKSFGDSIMSYAISPSSSALLLLLPRCDFRICRKHRLSHEPVTNIYHEIGFGISAYMRHLMADDDKEICIKGKRRLCVCVQMHV